MVITIFRQQKNIYNLEPNSDFLFECTFSLNFYNSIWKIEN